MHTYIPHAPYPPSTDNYNIRTVQIVKFLLQISQKQYSPALSIYVPPNVRD